MAVHALAALALAANARPAGPEVRAVRVTNLDFRAAVRILTSEGVPPGEVAREGGEVVIRIPAAAPENLALPALEKPLEGMRVEREPGRTIVRVHVAPEAPFEASHEPGMLTVVFGEQPAPELRGPVTPRALRAALPAGAAGAAAPAEEGAGVGRAGGEGIAVGPATLRPYVSASWVDADVLAFDNPIPVRDQYLEVAPGVTASMPFLHGVLAAEYEPRLRFFSDIPLVNETSHFAGARSELPVGSRALVRLGHRYTRAILETTVVDPGREYFFDLSRYTFNETMAAARVDLGARLSAEAEAGWRWARFDQKGEGGFFDYDSRAIRAGLGYDVGSDLRATVSYAFERIPPSPDRGLVESNAHSVVGALTGTIAPLTSGSVTVGFRRQTNPLATGESASYRGVTLGGTLRRELGRSSAVDLQWNRATEPSAYDTNAYYVANSVVASLSVPAPFEVWARGSVGFYRNDYPNDAPDLGAPRRDDILGWTLGLGRQIGWRAWVRADYRRERRDSNLPGFDVTHRGSRRAAGRGLLRPGTFPPMIATLLVLALLQTPPAPAVPDSQAVPPPAASPTVGDYEVGPGDVIEVAVYGNPDLSRIPTVQPNGSISLPLLRRGPGGGAHHRGGPAEDHEPPGQGLPREPAGRGEGHGLQEPVRVVVGEVNSPGRKPIRGRMRLIDVLVEAGGFTPRLGGGGDHPHRGHLRRREEVDDASGSPAPPPGRTRSTSSFRSRTGTSSPPLRRPSSPWTGR